MILSFWFGSESAKPTKLLEAGKTDAADTNKR